MSQLMVCFMLCCCSYFLENWYLFMNWLGSKLLMLRIMLIVTMESKNKILEWRNDNSFCKNLTIYDIKCQNFVQLHWFLSFVEFSFLRNSMILMLIVFGSDLSLPKLLNSSFPLLNSSVLIFHLLFSMFQFSYNWGAFFDFHSRHKHFPWCKLNSCTSELFGMISVYNGDNFSFL